MTGSWSAIDGLEAQVTPINSLPPERLMEMLAAGAEIEECYRVLKKGSANIVSELLKGQGTFYEYDHFPSGDVYDEEFGSQYYYHAHRGLPGEHGHFHTFVRQLGMPPGLEPVPYEGETRWPRGEDALSHVIAVSMDKYGFPIGMFGTNRWVTDEAWYTADDVLAMLDGYQIDHATPSWPVNRWLTAMLKLFRPQVAALLQHRDAVVSAWQEQAKTDDVFEDRKLEMTGWLRVSVRKQLDTVRGALK